MRRYPKINSVYKRDQKGKFLLGEFSCPEFEYLIDNTWEWSEKLDGTNIRIGYEANGFRGNEHAYIAGRSDNAQIPPRLLAVLVELAKNTPFEDVFSGQELITFYGEGIGAGIQKGGGNYIPDNNGFVLFDVLVGDFWLRRADVEDVASKLGLNVAPVVAPMTLRKAIDAIATNSIASVWPNVEIEGIVGRPAVDLYDRNKDRITVKVKGVDFK